MEHFLPTRQIPINDQFLLDVDYPQILQHYSTQKFYNTLKLFSDRCETVKQSGFQSSSKSQGINELNFMKLKATTPKRKAKVIQRLKKEKLDNKQLLCFKKNEGPKWKNFLEHVSESDCQILSFLCCKLKYVDSIRKVVTQISYPSLISIRIQSCPITNIEILQFINAPNLKFIHISDCSITNFKSLAKMYFKMLRQFKFYLVLDECCINDFSSVSRAYFEQSKNQSFDFRMSYYLLEDLKNKKYELNDLRFLVKLQLDAKGTNTLMKNGFNHIAKSKNNYTTLIRTLNARYQNMGVPERFIPNREEKTLMHYMIEKYQQWIFK